jgi:hypothetical protein
MSPFDRLAVRWTIGNVTPRGFEALRLSLWGARRCFGPEAAYAVCVNSLEIEDARERIGEIPDGVVWHAAHGLPAWLAEHLGPGMAEGVAWKFAPPRLFPDRFELALDNDLILWEIPSEIARWLEPARTEVCVLAEDVRPAFGQFADLAGMAPRNTGIRGLPPGFDLEAVLRSVLTLHPVRLQSELDEQGLQVAALSRAEPPHIVTTEEVTICSPFWPLQPHLGRCGAHFVGLNTRNLPWCWYDRPATECVAEHWDRHRPELYRRTGFALPA